MARKSGKARTRRGATGAHKWGQISFRLTAEAESDARKLGREDMLRPSRAAEPPPRAREAPAHGMSETGTKTAGFQNALDGVNELQLITDTLSNPMECIGLLKILSKNDELYHGTAWRIGPRTLATAAHNLLYPKEWEAKTIKVGMAYDGKSSHGGWHRAVKGKFSEGWSRQRDPMEGYDYAVLKVEDSIVDNQFGWLDFADYEDAKFDNMLVDIFGYPTDSGRFQHLHMYGVSGPVTNADGRLIYYDCDTDEGMSGGPVIARFGDRRIVVGIHVGGTPDGNVGTRINNAAYKFFKRLQNW